MAHVDDGFNPGTGTSETQEPALSQEPHVLVSAAAQETGMSFAPSNDDTATQGNRQQPLSAEETGKPLDSLNDKIAGNASAEEDSGPASSLEVKKKRLLEELESALLLPKEDYPVRVRPSLGIEVIDETALVETVSASEIGKKSSVKETDAVVKKNGKQSRRRTKGAKKEGRAKVTVTVAGMCEAQNGNGTKRKYSRKEMEALRFVNVGEQRKFWKRIYGGLENEVAKEYDDLAATTENQKHIRLNYDPRQCLAKKKEAPAILSVGAANGRWRYMNVFVH